jgi:hypothetical protein
VPSLLGLLDLPAAPDLTLMVMVACYQDCMHQECSVCCLQVGGNSDVREIASIVIAACQVIVHLMHSSFHLWECSSLRRVMHAGPWGAAHAAHHWLTKHQPGGLIEPCCMPPLACQRHPKGRASQGQGMARAGGAASPEQGCSTGARLSFVRACSHYIDADGGRPAFTATWCTQAVKGMAIAAAELRQFGELTFQPAFRHTNRTKPVS